MPYKPPELAGGLSPHICRGGNGRGHRGISVASHRKTGWRGVPPFTMCVMQACCVRRQRFWFRDGCCMICAQASCCRCPLPSVGQWTVGLCGRWCRHRVGRIANICCWFPVCVCVVFGTCGLICRGTCWACVHRVPCALTCLVCSLWWCACGGCDLCGHTPPIATDDIWLCVVVPLFVLWLLGSQVVTMSPVVCCLRCSIHVPRSVVVRARVHERWQAWHSPLRSRSFPLLVV